MGQIKHKLAQLKDVITLKLFSLHLFICVCVYGSLQAHSLQELFSFYYEGSRNSAWISRLGRKQAHLGHPSARCYKNRMNIFMGCFSPPHSKPRLSAATQFLCSKESSNEFQPCTHDPDSWPVAMSLFCPPPPPPARNCPPGGWEDELEQCQPFSGFGEKAASSSVPPPPPLQSHSSREETVLRRIFLLPAPTLSKA